jgi:hypothetical protein
MTTESILRELEATKERLAEAAGGGVREFLDQMDAWLERHPHAGPVVASPAELQARVAARARTEPVPPPAPPYRVKDPVIAEIHRIRQQLFEERQRDQSGTLVLKEEPPKPGTP